MELAGLKVRFLRGGTGSPLVVIHHSTGNPGWIPLYEKLAESFDVIVPDQPGWGGSERPEWAREARDLAILNLQALDKTDTKDVTVVGLGFGGFIAAEMATMNTSRIKNLVLVGAAGIQPDEGEILDQMIIDYEDYIKAGFSSDAAYSEVYGEEASPEFKQLWDFSREMTARVSWKPYMFNRRLPSLLAEVNTPTLLIWGSEDAVVPPIVGKQYAAALPNARLELVQGAGHLVEMEQPDTVASLIQQHAAG